MIAALLAALPAATSVAPPAPFHLASGPCPPPLQADDADDAFAFIAGLADKGLHEVVVREAQAFLESYPRHARSDDVRYALAGARFELGELQAARPLYERLAQTDGFGFPDEVRFRLGQCELDRGELQRALAAFESVGQGYLRLPALYLAGEACFQGERYGEAAERFEAVRVAEADLLRRDQAPETLYGADALHGLAWCRLRLDEPDAAVAAVRAFVTEYPGDGRGLELRFVAAEAHRAAQRWAEAQAFYGAVAGAELPADSPDRAWQEAALRGAAFSASGAGEPAAAAQGFALLLERFPEGRYGPEAALQRGVHLFLAGQAQAARRALQDPRLQPGATLEYWRGRAALADGDAQAAEAHLRAGLAASPGEALRRELASARGDALFELGRTPEAASSYEAAGTPYALHAGAVTHLNDGRFGEAERLTQRVLELAEEDDASAAELALACRLVLGEARFGRGAHGEAEPQFLAVAKAAKDPAQVARALSRAGWCRYLQEDWATAGDRFRTLLERFPTAPEAAEGRFLAGRCSERQGDAAAAVAAYDAYARDYPQGALRPEALLRAARLSPGEPGEQRLQRLLADHGQVPLAADGALELADRQAARGDLQAAAASYALTLAHPAPGAARHGARYGLGWCRFQAQDAVGALAVLAELVGDPEVPAELALPGQELRVFAARDAGDPAAGVAAFGAFQRLSQDPARRVAAAEVVAETLTQAGDLPAARRLLGSVAAGLEDPPAAARLAVARAYQALDAGDPDGAEARLGEALGLVPEHPAAREAAFFLGEARFEAADLPAAARAYDVAAASADPEVQSRALYKAGFARLRLAGEREASEQDKQRAEASALWARAAADFEALVAGHPRSELYGEGLYLAGECAYRGGRLEASAGWMGRLLQERPRHATRSKALFRQGLSQAKLARFAEAARTLATLRQEAPEFEAILEAELWRGESLLQVGELRPARQALERVARDDRGLLSARAYLALGRLAELQEDLDEALSQYLKVAVLYALDEEVAEALFRAGTVLEARGSLDQARAQYADAQARFPKTPYGARAAARLAQLSR